MPNSQKDNSDRNLRISAFDLDHTLINDNASYRFGRFLCRKKCLSFRSLHFIISISLLYRTGLLSIETLHKKAFNRLFLGRSAAEIRAWAILFVQENLENILYLPAIAALRKGQKEGHLAALLSSSPDFLVEPIAAYLEIPIWHATTYAVDKYGNFCHIACLMLGEQKKLLLQSMGKRLGVPVERIYAYSDSYLDLPFLQASGHPVGVHPDRRLRKICKHHRWLII